MKKDFETLDKIMNEIHYLRLYVENYEGYIFERALDKVKKLYKDEVHGAILLKIEHYLYSLGVYVSYFDENDEKHMRYVELPYKED